MRYILKYALHPKRSDFHLEAHFKICIALKKVLFSLDAYFKTCIAPKKVRFGRKTHFKICYACQKVRFWKESMHLASKNSILPITWDFFGGIAWNLLHWRRFSLAMIFFASRMGLTCWKLFFELNPRARFWRKTPNTFIVAHNLSFS